MRRISALFVTTVFFSAALFPPASYGEESMRASPVVNVIKEWAPSVVNIATERMVFLKSHPFWGKYGGVLDEMYKQVPAQSVGTLKLTSIGSGVIISQDGLILTNAHVINMASKIYVTFCDGTRVDAFLDAIDQSNDLALIKVTPPAGALKPVRLANDVMIGETVVAIGNSMGLANSVTAGIISGVNREIRGSAASPLAFKELIQTDAPINIGSSGGALFNLDGQLVGINLAIVQHAQSMGFAIPYTKIHALLQEYVRLKQKAALDKARQRK